MNSTSPGGDSENSSLKLSSSNSNKWSGVIAVRNSLKNKTDCLKSRKNEKNSAFNNNAKKKNNKRDLERMDSADSTGNLKTNNETSKKLVLIRTTITFLF